MTDQQIGDVLVKLLECAGAAALLVFAVKAVYRIKHPVDKDIYLK